MTRLLTHLFVVFILCSFNSVAFAKYVKVSNSGKALPDSAVLGSGANDWACTYDSNAKLIWEVKTDDNGLRDKDWTYTWYDTNSPDGNKGKPAGTTNCKTSGRCDTEKFTQDVNTQTLCSASDWRMPTRDELKTLVYCSSGTPATWNTTGNSCTGTYQKPTMDSTYFPNSPTNPWFWSASAYANFPNYAWIVFFDNGFDLIDDKDFSDAVRLVRGGQSFDPSVGATNIPPPPPNTPATTTSTNEDWKPGLTTSELPTSALFLDRFTADAGQTYGKVFSVVQKVDIDAKIKVAPEHLGRNALMYIVANYNGSWYKKSAKGWSVWDLTFGDLRASGTAHTLNNIEDVDVQKQLSGLPGNFAVYVGYEVDNLIHYNAQAFDFKVSDQTASSDVLSGEILPGTTVLTQPQVNAVTEVTPNSDGSLSVAISNNAAQNVKVGQIVSVPPNDALGLPLGFTGKVVSKTDASGNPGLSLEPAMVEDVFKKLKFDLDSLRDDAEIVDVIAPKNAKVSFKKVDADGKPFQKALKDSCINVKSLNITGELGCKKGSIEGTLKIEYKFNAKKEGSNEEVPTVLYAEATLTNGHITFSGDFDATKYTSSDGWAHLGASVNANLSAKVYFTTFNKTPIQIPSLSELLTDDKKSIWDSKVKVGKYFELSGLNGDDKKGLIPLGGLVISPVGAVIPFTGVANSTLVEANHAASIILWVYIDLSGKVTLKGDATIIEGKNLIVSKGFDLKAVGNTLNDVYDRSKEPTGQPTITSSLNGTLDATQNAGVVVAVDLFTGGIRPAGIQVHPIKATINQKLSATGGYQYFPTSGWYGNVCMDSLNYKITSDVIFNAAIHSKLDVGWFDDERGLTKKFFYEKVWGANSFSKSSCFSSEPLTFTTALKPQDTGSPGNRLVEIDLQTAYNSAALQAIASQWVLVDSYTDGTTQTKNWDLTEQLKTSNPSGKVTIYMKAGTRHTLKLETRKKTGGIDYGTTKESATQVLDIPSVASTGCSAPQVLQNGVCVTPQTPTCIAPQVLQDGVCVTPQVPSTGTCTGSGNSTSGKAGTISTAIGWTEMGLATSGCAFWEAVSISVASGGEAAQSGKITDNNLSNLELQVEGPGQVNFRWAVSSEKDYDLLYFRVMQGTNVVKEYKISGEIDWQTLSVDVPSGSHKLSWSYQKDDSGTEGTDAGWLDDVVFTPANTPNVSWLGKTLFESTGWKSEIDISCLDNGSKCGKINFRALDCAATLTYIGKQDSRFIFSETIEYGSCTHGCNIELEQDGSSYKEYCGSRYAGGGELTLSDTQINCVAPQILQNGVCVNPSSGNVCAAPPVTIGNLEVQACDYSSNNNFSFTWTIAKSVVQSYGSGWHLPTKDELNVLYQNQSVVGSFENDYYWSSTGRLVCAWAQNFGNGSQACGSQQHPGYSDNTARVRAVRAF